LHAPRLRLSIQRQAIVQLRQSFRVGVKPFA
jgi:hypothetical protein